MSELAKADDILDDNDTKRVLWLKKQLAKALKKPLSSTNIQQDEHNSRKSHSRRSYLRVIN